MPGKDIVPYCDMDRIRLGSPKDAQRLAQATGKAHRALEATENALYGVIEQP